jgi:hypothetical protein
VIFELYTVLIWNDDVEELLPFIEVLDIFSSIYILKFKPVDEFQDNTQNSLKSNRVNFRPNRN